MTYMCLRNTLAINWCRFMLFHHIKLDWINFFKKEECDVNKKMTGWHHLTSFITSLYTPYCHLVEILYSAQLLKHLKCVKKKRRTV